MTHCQRQRDKITRLIKLGDALRATVPVVAPDPYPGVRVWCVEHYAWLQKDGGKEWGCAKHDPAKMVPVETHDQGWTYCSGHGVYDAGEITGQKRIDLIERALKLKPDIFDPPKPAKPANGGVVLFQHNSGTIYATKTNNEMGCARIWCLGAGWWGRVLEYPLDPDAYAAKYPNEKRLTDAEAAPFLAKHPLPANWLGA